MRSIAARTRVTTSMVRSSFCISTMPNRMSVLIVAAGDAQAWREADLIVRDIRQNHRQAALLADHDVVNVAD